MMKKLVVGGLVVALIGALVLGVYSLSQRNDALRAGQALAQGNGEQGYRGGRGNEVVAPGYDNDGGQGYRGGQTGDVDQAGCSEDTAQANPQADVGKGLCLVER